MFYVLQKIYYIYIHFNFPLFLLLSKFIFSHCFHTVQSVIDVLLISAETKEPRSSMALLYHKSKLIFIKI